MINPKRQIEEALVAKLRDIKYEYCSDIRDREALGKNFREKFEALNRVTLTDGEFQRLLDQIATANVYEAARSLRNREAFERDDGTPLNYTLVNTLVNTKDWCKNTFEVVNQLRIKTDNSYHRYDVTLLINGVPVVQIELKALGISPRRATQQIVHYKSDPGNGYTRPCGRIDAGMEFGGPGGMFPVFLPRSARTPRCANRITASCGRAPQAATGTRENPRPGQ